jgi:hypothetical protein
MASNDMNLNFKKLALYGLVIFLIATSIYKYLNTLSENRLIESDQSIARGKITDFYVIGVHHYFYEYSFVLDNEVYYGEDRNDFVFPNCEKDEKCINKDIYIKYFNSNPNVNQAILDSFPNNWYKKAYP